MRTRRAIDERPRASFCRTSRLPILLADQDIRIERVRPRHSLIANALAAYPPPTRGEACGGDGDPQCRRQRQRKGPTQRWPRHFQFGLSTALLLHTRAHSSGRVAPFLIRWWRQRFKINHPFVVQQRNALGQFLTQFLDRGVRAVVKA